MNAAPRGGRPRAPAIRFFNVDFTAARVRWRRRSRVRRDRSSRRIHMKRLMALILIALFSAGTLSACNTVKGVGKDVEKVGDKVQDAADDTGGTDPR
jgi:entericidin A